MGKYHLLTLATITIFSMQLTASTEYSPPWWAHCIPLARVVFEKPQWGNISTNDLRSLFQKKSLSSSFIVGIILEWT